jgi:hypothetical protein
MTLCPIALAVGCKKCPVFSMCPLTKVIGDQPKAAAVPVPAPAKTAKPSAGKAAAKSGGSRKR